jgi:hypothetical protein
MHRIQNIKKQYRRLILVPVFLFLMSLPAICQEIIDEDFIDILSQNAKELLNEQDADFATNTIPDKWVDESVVGIGYKKHILFDKKRSGLLGGKENLVLLEKKRMKVKLIDKRSVESFSELYFRYSSKFDGFGAVIYKPDGTKKEIALTKAVSIEDNDNVPEFFKSFFDQNVSNRNEYYKVPVADLLPGDILEFVSQTSSTLNVKKTPYYQFDPQYELCQKGMPIMTHKIIIETDNNSFITARSINGAPDFQQSTNGDFNVYSWTDKNRDRLKDVNFINEYMVLPLVKFQITYTDGREIKSLFAGTKGQMKSKFEVNEIGKKAAANYSGVGNTWVYGASTSVDNIAGMLWGKIKANGGKDVVDDEFIKMAYYYIRHTQVFSNYYYSDKQFCYLFSTLLSQRKMNYDIIVSTPNNLTTPNDLLFESELSWCVRVKDKYIFKPTEHSNLFDIDEGMINNDGFKLPLGREQAVENVKIIDTRVDNNKSLFQLNVSVDSSLKWLKVDRTSAYNGIQKEKNSYAALRFTTYMFSDSRTFNGPDDFENVPEKYMQQVFQQKKAITDEFKERKPEYQKEQAERDLEADVQYKEFTMVNEGRSFKKPELMFKESFMVSDKIRKAGKKLLINLPGLMGGQLQIRKEEREARSFDIDVRYPRKLKWQINLTVPAGYAVEGVEGLNTKVDNETGAFNSEAVVKDGVLTITIEKIYKQKNITKEKWPQMLEFVDAAYNFTHKLILLKPI